MKAEELRIGNLIKGIYHDYDDGIDEEIENETICKVVTLDVSGSGDYQIYVYSDENIEHFSDFEPITLIEEWLLKFGFEINPENFNWNAGIGENAIMDFKLSLRYTEEIGWFYKSRCTPIKYVHQLQNLYFALTGEELKQQEQ